ncbi:major facilitator superfamily transporter [Colletotrichum graminicola]|uniref:Major facilitator superfamily transporter n=1 Tax=Colletotrichum graminicola (strain M1.001 / M2 / FGSC 10212) TaxID=645133 RepID=E3QSD9_COLGM|nr:major facilitator superfamily transporter [Colletotrichum graminicola M1.001]EFQ33766.1 major facilitator superfamily transporter [Colletotrichum graminicola M1.001]WDK21034.1 major facilitator superfamily transporter [Colletotrichum graminicola]
MAVTRTSSDRSDIENVSPDKEAIRHEECQIRGGMRPEDVEFLANLPEEKKKKAVRKVDYRLIPMLVLLYLMAYLDKTNIGNAKIEGLLGSLGMTGVQYNVAVSVFFIPFVLAEVPSNMVLHLFQRPSLYIGGIVTCWGIVMTCNGVVQNYGGLVAARIFLGLFEAGFLPGAILIISKWYLPNETQTRIALLYTSAASGGGFSGLLAFGIARMDGVGGYEGWRWIFILEGLATVAIGVACFFFLIDSPSLSKWLDDDEKRYLILRQESRRVVRPDEFRDSHFDKQAFISVLTDWKIYLLILVNWSNAVPNYAMKFTMPQIIKNMGYTSANAQLLTIPPYAVGALSAYGFSVFADRHSWRMPFIVGPQLCLVVAFSILFAKSADIKHNIALCYFAVCLACFGMYPILPGVNAWNVANTPSPTKRAVSIGFLVCVGNVGGLIGSYIYIDKEAPRYPTGFGTSFAFASAGIVAAITLEVLLHRLNKNKALISEEEVRQRYTDEELDRMGEKSPLFKYAI